MDIRPYVPDDLPGVQRTWRECGWVSSDAEAALLEHFLADATAFVADLDGAAEAAVTAHAGTLTYDRGELPLAAVTSVLTSHVARKRGIATRLGGRLLAACVEQGAAAAVLGMFEQGFYDRLGFGTGAYEIRHTFDPASLAVDVPRRTPVRIGPDDAGEVAALLATRRRAHGAVALPSASLRRAEMGWLQPWFGLGLRDDDSVLTGAIGGTATEESGPYTVQMLAYRTERDLLDLLGLLRSLGDQVRRVRIPETPEIQLQDLIGHPGRQDLLTRGGPHHAVARADAWWQARILDLPACVAARRWDGRPVRANLVLDDPLSTHGVDQLAGEWRIEVGAGSRAERGAGDPALPTLRAGVGAFTRMWLGVRPASSLSVTGDLDAPDELLRALDEAFRLPTPRVGMEL